MTTSDQFRLYRGHDPEAGVDVLLTVWDDGTAEVAFRPGKDRTDLTWDAPLKVKAVAQ